MPFVSFIGLSTGTWACLTVLLALYLLVAGPALAACLYTIYRTPPDALDRAVEEIECFIELRERAHRELATTGSLDRFQQIKDEARKHL